MISDIQFRFVIRPYRDHAGLFWPQQPIKQLEYRIGMEDSEGYTEYGDWEIVETIKEM